MYKTSGDDRVDLFRLLVALGIRMRAQMDRRLSVIGLTTQQAAVLTFLETSDAALNVRDVSRLLGTTHQNARQIVAALERKGLLVDEPDPDDRRARRLRLTAAVAETFAGREAQDRAAVREWTRCLDDAEVARAVALLGRLLDGGGTVA
jgi:DNA-binding MarR family transcriptional regulator